MSEYIRAKGKDFASFLETLTPEQIAYGNAVSHNNALEEFNRFIENFDQGICYLCGNSLASFSKKLPCPHWLMKPKGFKKK